jgi:signal peptidase I
VTSRLEPQLGDLAGIDAPQARRSVERPPANNRPRKPWLAVVVAFLFGPVAFAYAGVPLLGLVVVALQVGVAAICGRTGLIHSLAAFRIVAIFFVVSWLFAVFAPYFLARTRARVYAPRWFNRWYVYVVYFLLTLPVLSAALLHKDKVFGFATYRMPTASMMPTLGAGDLILADMREEVAQNPRIGDIVVHASTLHPEQRMVRRVVAGPRQHVVIDENGLAVDGAPADRTHVLGSDVARATPVPVDVVLGPDQFYLMGDNRENAYDSRIEGPYSRSQLRGKVTVVWYSLEGSRIGTLAQ